MDSSTFDSLHIIGSTQVGGAERFFSRLIGVLVEKGHRAAAVYRPKSPLRDLLDSEIDHFHVAMRNGWDILSLWAIRRLIVKTNPVIVQTYMGRATRLTRIPSSSRAIHVARLGGFYKIKGYYEHAHAWVGNTKGICDYLIRSGMDPDRVFHIGNFVEIPSPKPSEVLRTIRGNLQLPEDAIIIFSLGRFIPKKGFQDLIQSLRLVPKEIKGRPIYLVIAGDGPLRDRLEAAAQDLGIAHRIRWVGWQDDPSPFYELAHIFVCPSREEPLGNVVLEAWSHRLPVIATRTPGPLELIEEGRNGLLVPIGEPEKLAQCLTSLLHEDKASWLGLGSNGLKTLMASHSKESVVNAYLSMYEKLRRLH